MSYAGAQPSSADFIDSARCTASRFDVRCQLRDGHTSASPHIAMTRHASSRRQGFAIWTLDGRSWWEAEVGYQEWAPTFPRTA